MKLTKKVRMLLIVVLAGVFLVSGGVLLSRTLDYQKGEEDYSEAEDLVDLPDFSSFPAPTVAPVQEPLPGASQPSGEPEAAGAPAVVYIDPYADALRAMDFTALQEVNGDVLGWILIPGTVISYPLVQGEDNDYYLNHTWKGWRSAVGAIFLEWQCSSDLSDFNTIVYGHRMQNGSMFASLKNYKQYSYWKNHPCVYITNDSGSYKYDIFAAYEVSIEGDTYRLGFSTGQSKQDFIDYCLGQSVINTGIVPQTYDQMLTLSTCTGRGHATRWVVQAVLRGEPPVETEEPPAESDAPDGESEPAAPAGSPAEPENPTEPETPTEPDAPAEPEQQPEPEQSGEPDTSDAPAGEAPPEELSAPEEPEAPADGER